MDKYGNVEIISLRFRRIAAFELQKSYSASVWMIQLRDHMTKDFLLSLRTFFKLLVFHKFQVLRRDKKDALSKNNHVLSLQAKQPELLYIKN